MSARISPLLLLLALAACYAAAPASRGGPVISEFMAANTGAVADEDGAYSDWIEIHNPDLLPINLEGWHLTDSETNKTKWRFPAVTLPGSGYLVVFASSKNRTDESQPLHTNFALSASGEYLALVTPDGSVAHEFAPGYPAQPDNVSYGLPPDNGPAGFFYTPTPGRPNAAAGGSALLEQQVTFSRQSGPFTNPFPLELFGALPGQQIRYIADSTGTSVGEPSSSSPAYTGPLPIGASTVISAAVFSEDGLTRGPVQRAYFTRVTSSVSAFSSHLPVLVIDTMGSGELVKDGIDHPGYVYTYGGRTENSPIFRGPPQVISPLTASVRGSSSASFPKRSFTLKLADEPGQSQSAALLDLPAYEKWALVGPWSFDHSYANNAFMYALSNQIGRWAPRTRFAEVFLNTGGDLDSSDYAGLYLLTDRIEIGEGRVELANLTPSDPSGGYLLKVDVQDDNEFGWRGRLMPQSAESSIVVVSPKAEKLLPEARDYIVDYVRRMEEALQSDADSGFAQRTYLDFIDRASWVDHHILNTFSCNPDAFERSAYFTKDRGGKLQAGPIWDFDRALGSYWDERSFRYDVWSGVGAIDVWHHGWWGVIARDPEFMQDWVDRWQSLRRTELANSNLATLADAMTNQIGEAAAARDAARWPDNAQPRGSYAAQAQYLRGWTNRRAEWIDAQFVAAPTVAQDGGNLIFTAPQGAELVYTLDGSDPRSLGGAIAPNAETSKSAVVVPASANIHVRSYRADMKDTFPGSPWSAAVGGPESSPLAPRARLINLSSRAIVGSGENALIAGVVVADTTAKRYLARGVGPALAAFGASGIVPDPQLSIFGANGVELFRNNGWETAPEAARIPSYSRAVGAFPLATGSRDSATASQVSAGAYTVQITSPAGSGGIGLAELYELDANGRTVNLSTRAHVGTGDGVLIGGFVVQGPAYKRMLIRAVGPTLRAFGLEAALSDPQLTVYSGSEIVVSNDRWEANTNAPAVLAASRSAGAFDLAAGSEDAALLITLKPGAYTVEVRGKNGSEGVALLEIYEVP